MNRFDRHIAKASVEPASFRQSMAWLHTWAGLLPGWLLYLIFLFGTAAFFQQEISRWMRPELGSATVAPAALESASAFLARQAPGAASWTVTLPPARGGEPLSLAWKASGDGKVAAGKATLDPTTGRELKVRDTRGGFFLYRFHFDLYYMPVLWARLIVSIAALAMLVAILSGIVTHKKIFADFFLLRFGKGQRSWLDAHNVTAVLALPFHLMITYTGLVTLLFTLMPWAISANYPVRADFFKDAFPQASVVEARGTPAPMIPLAALATYAEAAGGFRAGTITILQPGDAAAMAQVSPTPERLGGSIRPIYLSALTGALMPPSPAIGGAQATQRVMIDLHAGRFAGWTLRWLYFLSGAGGTVMVASGLVLWTVKRRGKLPDPTRPHFGFRLVERLNIGVIAGAPAGIATYFLTNRLLPLTMPHRADWEVNSLFIAWGALVIWTLVRTPRRAWIEALAACAVLFVLVPIVNAAATDRGLIPSLIACDWVFAGFDLVMLMMAAVCAFTAHKIGSHKTKAVSARRTRKLADANA